MDKIKYKKMLVIITIVITMALTIGGCAKEAPEGVVARVNKENITIEDFDEEYQIQAKTMENRLGEGVLDQVGADGKLVKEDLRDEILNIFIIERLILQDAEKNNITVSDDKVDQRIEDIKANMGGEEELKKYQESVGMDQDYLKMFVKKDIILEDHKADYIKKLEFKDKEIKEFFDENKDSLTLVKARHILLETQEEGEEVLKRLKDGEDFKSLAIENSIDAETALQGGELGYFPKGKNAKEFDKVVFELDKGDISPLIEGERGYHIVEVQEVKDTFESLKDEVIHFASENKYLDYLASLQDNAKIEIYLDDKDKGKEKAGK